MKVAIHPLRWGNFILLEGDMISSFSQYYGEWAEVEVQIFRSLLQPNDNVIEVGANIGMHAVPLAKTIPQGKLFCFEPQRIIHQILCGNVALNQLTNVKIYQQAVGSSGGGRIEIETSDYSNTWNYGSFSLEKGFSSESTFEGNTTLETVEIVALDEVTELQALPHLKLLKIDAEGFETQVLSGASQLIEKHKPLIFVEALPNEKFMPLLTTLEEMNYCCYWVVSDRYQKKNFFNKPPLAEIEGSDFNFLCYPKSVVENQPEQAPFYLTAVRDTLVAEGQHYQITNLPKLVLS